MTGDGREVSRQTFDDITLEGGEVAEGTAERLAWEYSRLLREDIMRRGLVDVYAVEVKQVTRHRWAAILWRLDGGEVDRDSQ
jgi:hypothetical protein